jgi:hypothetical protein
MVILVIVAFGGTFFVRNILTKRAVSRVIKIFYQHNALGIHGAKTLREMGLERPDFLQRMVKPRDYKQYALQILVKKGIIHVNVDGRVYLVEENLDPSLRYSGNGR